MFSFSNYRLALRQLAFILVFLLCFGSAAAAFSAVVVKVSDGDTLQVRESNGTVTKIRLYGVDSPETAQPYGKASASFLDKAAFNRTVNIKTVETDQYGRLVAIVTVKNENISLNAQLVRQGYAWYYPQYCRSGAFCKTLKGLEQQAREQKLGLWREPNPTPPWEFRRNAKNSAENGLEDYNWEEKITELSALLKQFFRAVKAFLFNLTELLAKG